MEKGSNLAEDDDERPSSDGRASTRTFKNRGIDPGKRERERERERESEREVSQYLFFYQTYQIINEFPSMQLHDFFFSEVITI